SATRLEILEPRDQNEVPANYLLYLRASASAGSKDLGSHIRWRSDRDGFLGQGAEVAVTLSAGEHRIRATVGRRREDRLGRSGGADDQSTQEDETGSDDVTVNAVPIDYSGGDT
ncbi:MAG: hypothetical protein AAFY88_18445, partial [Acidobacteriota bacterium]